MFEPKIIAFLCTWCSYTGADLAGTSRFKSPYNVRAIRVPCSGRVSPELVMRAFDQGADGVLVLGCHIGECHYDTGNHRAAKRMPLLQNLMDFVGLERQRLKLDWVSASEGERFAHLVNEFVEGVRSLGPVRWRNQYSGNGSQWHPRITQTSQEYLPNEEQNKLITKKIQETSQNLISSGAVSCVIGYEVGPRGRTRPTFISSSEEVERLVWNQACTHNLSTYLKAKISKSESQETSHQLRIAVVAKPCDSRSINILLAENRFKRDQVYIIGVSCPGIEAGAGFGKNSGRYQNRCLICSERKPVVYDTLIGETPVVKETPHIYSPISALDRKSTAQRMEFWLSQFDRCIRCYACRQACPTCDCPTCLYERDDSLWTGMNIDINEKRTFHLGRAYHLAGRCVGCDECERVCPMEIPISLLNAKLAEEMKVAFDFRAGLTVAPSPITTPLVEEAKA